MKIGIRLDGRARYSGAKKWVGNGGLERVCVRHALPPVWRFIQIVTNCESWEGTAIAIGLDLLIVALECAIVAAVGTKAYKPVARFAHPALCVAFLWSDRSMPSPSRPAATCCG
jgi:hypothetical protein